MKGVIIAAGPSTRLRPLTENLPKCMLKIDGKPIIQNTMELFRKNGINDISVIRGYQKDKINFKNVEYFDNDDFWDNNILHSLMHARKKLEEAVETKEDVVVSYSDIWYNDYVLKALLADKHDIAVVVDAQWQDYYEGRTDHPLSEAEKAVMKDGRLLMIGKRLKNGVSTAEGEFIGLWKFSPKGVKIFLKHFDRLDKILSKETPFQNAKQWQKSYMTDIFQEMLDKGEKIYCAIIKKNWKEFDTVQDFKRIGGHG